MLGVVTAGRVVKSVEGAPQERLGLVATPRREQAFTEALAGLGDRRVGLGQSCKAQFKSAA